MTASPLIAFHAGTGTDHRGRSLDDILHWDDGRLEQVHDFIQWLFPLPTRSAFNPYAPTLSEADIAAFRESPALRERATQAFDRMLAFYGFERAEENDEAVIRTAAHFAVRRRVWLTPGNYNHLRISRILQFLRLAGLQPLANAYWRALADLYEAYPDDIGERTLRYWREAAG